MTNYIEVLNKCSFEDNIVKLPTTQLDRKLYLEVAKNLELIGGKWKGGKVMGFVFQEDPTQLLKEIASGNKRNIKKEFQFYATPDYLADYLVQLASLETTDIILEPSAGQGAIIKAINKVCKSIPDCFELLELNQQIILKSDLNYTIIGYDFLKERKKIFYSKIIANPPFSKNQDIDHVLEMYACLRKGGRIVSITSESWMNGNQKKQLNFQQWVQDVNASIYDIPKGSFKQSGTMVGGKILVIDKD